MENDIVRVGAFERLVKWSFRLVFVFGLTWIWTSPILAQDTPADTTVTSAATADEQPAEEAAEESTIKTKMSLTGDQYPDGTIALNGLLRAKIEGAYEKVPGKPVTFFTLTAEGEEKSIGNGSTGPDGVAILKVNKSQLTKDADGSFSVLARFDGDNNLEGSESDLMLKPATLAMEPLTADSLYTISLKATADSPDGPVPIAAAPVKVYIKRMFSSLKIAEAETDENGAVDIDFPTGMAGDDDGNIEITAIIEETEEYGNLTATTKQQWGYAVSSASKDSPRALWSPHPPLWMVITFFILMGAVWIHYVIIIINLFRIKADKNIPLNKT